MQPRKLVRIYRNYNILFISISITTLSSYTAHSILPKLLLPTLMNKSYSTAVVACKLPTLSLGLLRIAGGRTVLSLRRTAVKVAQILLELIEPDDVIFELVI